LILKIGVIFERNRTSGQDRRLVAWGSEREGVSSNLQTKKRQFRETSLRQTPENKEREARGGGLQKAGMITENT